MPLRSTSVALPVGTSSGWANCESSLSVTGLRPSWPRQRLTLARSPPPSPPMAATFTSAFAPLAPETEYSVSRNCDGGTLCQLDGTVQMEGAAASWVTAAGGGGIVCVTAVSKETDFRNSRNLAFCEATDSSSPVILKNQLMVG